LTYAVAIKINPTLAIFFPLTPYPGTPVFENFLSHENRPSNVQTWTDFIMTSNNAGISVNEKFSGSELRKIADSFNRRFYFRPRQITDIAKTISNTKEFFNIFRGFVSVACKAITSNK